MAHRNDASTKPVAERGEEDKTRPLHGGKKRAPASDGSEGAASGPEDGQIDDPESDRRLEGAAIGTPRSPGPQSGRTSSADDAYPAPQIRDRSRYTLLEEHGRGGLGRVFRARDEELARDIAVKELLQSGQRSEARFFREAFITARLEHPAIVPVHEAGRWPDGTPFYAMKLVAGRPLSELIHKSENLDQRLALMPHMLAVADAIAYAHDRQIIHRDLKPSNVIVGQFGETVVIDWGLAKDLSESGVDESQDGPDRAPASRDLTVVGSVLGTPAYMSPEQARGESVDTRSDVYSLGAMLYQLCTGESPPAESVPSNQRRALRRVSEDLASIVLKCLSPAPDGRYPDASALAADLRAYDTGARIAARRYSLAGVLSHWIRHHKAMTLSIAVPTVLAAIVGAVALRQIVLQRDRASTAQRRAEQAQRNSDRDRVAALQERDRAVRSEAALLLEKDPTRARDLLASLGTLGPDEALLMARAQGAWTADRVISLLPYKIWNAATDPALEKLAIASSDNRLRIIDLTTGRVEIVEDQLLEPPLVVYEAGGFTYARHGRGGPEIIRTARPSAPIALGRYRNALDNQAVATPDGLYLLGAKGDLVLLSPAGVFLPVGSGFLGIAPFRGGLLACNDRDLVRIERDRVVDRLAPCRYRGWHPLAALGDGFVVQSDPTTVLVERHGTRQSLPLAETNDLVIAANGLVAGANPESSWYLLPGASEKTQGPWSELAPLALGADGDIAAWGYADGLTRIRNTRTGATWSFVGHPAPIVWTFVSEKLGRVVTIGGPEVRVWRIPPFSLQRLGALPRGALVAASSPDGNWVAFDGADGNISLLNRRDLAAGVRTLHRHDGLAFGVTWRGSEACSAGRDGKVICTDVSTGQTRVLTGLSSPVRFVDGAGDVLAYTVEDGGVWAHVSGETTPRLLYRHSAEPYRVAVSAAGDVASGANDGSVMVYERSTGRVHTATGLHRDRIFQIHWQGDQLQTASYDGSIRTWSRDLSKSIPFVAARPVRDMELTRTGWVASVDASQLWFHTDGRDFELLTGPVIMDLAVSTDSRFVGAIVGRDVVFYDLRDRALAAIRIGDESGTCIHFVDATTVLVCANAGAILSVSAEKLPFVKLLN